ncbi:hypothetical protein EDD22DRAFT_961298 [Suillus occidentalis]|nr:hypothetical protein EDD22DRAFT_961298 [Suillus occidentalis]
MDGGKMFLQRSNYLLQVMDTNWCDLQESGFVNGDHAQSEKTPPIGQRRLTAGHAKELVQLQQAQAARTTSVDQDEDQDDDMGNVSGEHEQYYDNNFANANNEDSQKDSGYMSSSDDECDRPLSRKRKHSATNLSEDSPTPLQQEHRQPCKICKSKGRVAAHDYEVAVQQLIKFAIGDFRGRLASEEACVSHDIEIGFNGEIIQMITRRTSHLTSEVKAKLRSLIESLYGFNCSTRESVKSKNCRLVQDLKHKFGLCYRDLGDKKNNVPRSGLYKTRLNQKGVNLLWYQNKRDEGIMFEKKFTPFPIPALALVYTAVECCIDEWTDGEWTDINFSSAEYKDVYDKHLANLRKFNTQTKAHGILDSILKAINDNGRLHARVDTTDVACGDYLSDVEINNAIRESLQGGDGRNESDCDSADEVDSDNSEHE